MKATLKTEKSFFEYQESGWIEVDEDLNIEWSLDVDHPREHELRKVIHAIDRGHEPVIPKNHRAVAEDGVVGDGLMGEPEPVDVITTIKKKFDENRNGRHPLLISYKDVTLDDVL